MKKPIMLTATSITLIEEFMSAYIAAIDEVLSIGAITDATSLARAREEAIAAVARDPKFCGAWADPEFRGACSTALESKSKEVTYRFDLRAKMERYIELIKARLPDGEEWHEFFTDSELGAIGAECGLTDEDVEQFIREIKSKFN
jgi:hypothetical protein